MFGEFGQEGFVLGKGAYQGQTTVHPLGLVVIIVLGILMVALPRRHAMISVLACASFIAVGQRVVILTLDFNFLRLMVISGWLRIILHREYLDFRWRRLDQLIVFWAFVALIAHPISHGPSVIMYKLGVTFDSLGMYFMVRMLVRDLDDIKGIIESMAIISIPVACLFLVEHSTQRNLFAIFGGVPDFTMIREGKLRCQGAYSHPILAGCFWAAAVPLFAGRIVAPGAGRIFAFVGLGTSLTIIKMCSSSTPVVGVLAAIVGLAVFPFRKSMRTVRWVIVLVLIVLHFNIKKGVWHLLARTDLIGGSTGWHRFQVMDQFISHFSEWALFGKRNIDHWDIFMNDITNQYALDGLRGGAASLILFLAMIAVAFGNVGRLWRSVANSQSQMVLAWSIGVSLFVHTVNFVGVSYFGQIDMLWYIGLALTAVEPSKLTQKAQPLRMARLRES